MAILLGSISVTDGLVGFEKGNIRFDEDLVKVSKEQVMMSVEVATSLGKATKAGTFRSYH